VQPDGSVVDDPDGSVVVVPDGSVEPPDASVGPDACAGEETFAEADLGPYLIPDDDPLGILLAIDVVDMCARVETVEVSVDVTHTFRGDIGMSLTSPGGDSITLFTPDGSDAADDINEVLQVDIASGEDANGTWILEVFDNASPDEGTLDRWSLGINRSAP
jgi:subtilisin-like proprotein convertase family protein